MPKNIFSAASSMVLIASAMLSLPLAALAQDRGNASAYLNFRIVIPTTLYVGLRGIDASQQRGRNGARAVALHTTANVGGVSVVTTNTSSDPVLGRDGYSTGETAAVRTSAIFVQATPTRVLGNRTPRSTINM